MPDGLPTITESNEAEPATKNTSLKRKRRDSNLQGTAKQGAAPSGAPVSQAQAKQYEDLTKARPHQDFDVCGAVVLGDEGKWVELRCDKCNGNSGKATKRFWGGIRGFSKHYQNAHNETPGPKEILSRCSVRTVPMAEVEQINAGTVSIQKRPGGSADGGNQ